MGSGRYDCLESSTLVGCVSLNCLDKIWYELVAALELAKRGAVDLQQEATFAPLLLRVKA